MIVALRLGGSAVKGSHRRGLWAMVLRQLHTQLVLINRVRLKAFSILREANCGGVVQEAPLIDDSCAGLLQSRLCSSIHRTIRTYLRFQGLLTHTCTIQRLGESTIILPHTRNDIDRVGEIHLLRVTGESIRVI
jgi:hypothetical protein